MTRRLVDSHLRIVPERTAFVIERFGKYAKTLTPGLHLLIPFVSLLDCVFSFQCADLGKHLLTAHKGCLLPPVRSPAI